MHLDAFRLAEALHDRHGGEAELHYYLACEMLDECRPPTPAEITAIAAALGCPVERLTVSREELERQLEGERQAHRVNALRAQMAEAELEKWVGCFNRMPTDHHRALAALLMATGAKRIEPEVTP